MKAVPHALDVSQLPDHAFSHRSPMWWATLGVMLAEGTMFALLLGAYGFLRGNALEWPSGLNPPGYFWGAVNTVILLVSCIPSHLYKKAAEEHDLRRVQLWLSVSVMFGVAFLIVRVLEFGSLNCNWADNAYASIVWVLLGFHTIHLATDVFDTVVLAVLMFTHKPTGKRFVDVSENGIYWYFVVVSWLPIAAALYIFTRW